MNTENDTSRFTIHDEAAETPDALYVADAENLRIEKLSTRITLVAVLIPCLLVIVLAVAYLDIKNRVINTQSTGTMGVQNLAKDLESRFSSLSLRQAKLEAQLEANTQAVETGTAGLQVKLKKAITGLEDRIAGKANQSEITALDKRIESTLAALKKEVADLDAAFSKFDEELADQILLMAKGLKEDQERLAAVEKKALQLDGEKLSKESLNLSLGLERLALQELVKDKIRAVEKKLASVDKQIDTIDRQLKAHAKQLASPPPPRPVPEAPASGSSTIPPSQSSGIEEQTIK